MAAATGPLERFLKAIYEVHSVGVALPETCYYPDIKRRSGAILMLITQPLMQIAGSGMTHRQSLPGQRGRSSQEPDDNC